MSETNAVKMQKKSAAIGTVKTLTLTGEKYRTTAKRGIIEIDRKCWKCGKITSLEVRKSSYERWRYGALIQECFPKESVFFRETIINGQCAECQSKMYHIPLTEGAWGKFVCECDICGTSIYEADNGECASCHYKMEVS